MELTNSHCLIVGATGCGKTTVEVKKLVKEAERKKSGIVVVDPHDTLSTAVFDHLCERGMQDRVIYDRLSDKRLACRCGAPRQTRSMRPECVQSPRYTLLKATCRSPRTVPCMLLSDRQRRSIPADECRASRAVIWHAIIRPERSPFQAPGTRNTLGPSTAPHFFETKVVRRSKIGKHTAIAISSGGCL